MAVGCLVGRMNLFKSHQGLVRVVYEALILIFGNRKLNNKKKTSMRNKKNLK